MVVVSALAVAEGGDARAIAPQEEKKCQTGFVDLPFTIQFSVSSEIQNFCGATILSFFQTNLLPLLFVE